MTIRHDWPVWHFPFLLNVPFPVFFFWGGQFYKNFTSFSLICLSWTSSIPPTLHLNKALLLCICVVEGGGGSLTGNTSSTLRLACAVTTITQFNRSRHSTIENFYTSFFPVLLSIVLTFPPLYYLAALSVCTPFSVSPLWVLANPVHKGINDNFLRGKPEDVL
jgi:hypothetical protein